MVGTQREKQVFFFSCPSYFLIKSFKIIKGQLIFLVEMKVTQNHRLRTAQTEEIESGT